MSVHDESREFLLCVCMAKTRVNRLTKNELAMNSAPSAFKSIATTPTNFVEESGISTMTGWLTVMTSPPRNSLPYMRVKRAVL